MRMQMLCALLLAAIPVKAAEVDRAPLVGLDHIPFVVKNLEQSSSDYRALGFAIKPGRLHDNGISNSHIKFPDGSGIELITAAQARDRMTTRYLELLEAGEGAAYLSFHARDTDRFLAALDASGFGYSSNEGVVRLNDPRFDFIFFGRDNRSPTDRPEHFAHPNTAVAMTGVWVATADHARFTALLTRLGAVARKERVLAPKSVDAIVISVANGRVVLLPEAMQLIRGRPIVGAEFEVSKETGPRDVFVSPEKAHGIWLRFSRRQGI